jgi:hypothetical protein
MIKPISLRLRNTAILREAYTILDRAGKGALLRQSRNARILNAARATLARLEEQARLRKCARLAAFKALHAVREAYRMQEKINSGDEQQKRWRERRELVETELMRIVELGPS